MATNNATNTSNPITIAQGGTGATALTGVLTYNGIFGDGSDGTQTFDGASDVLGITPSGNDYTLARDIFLDSSTIDSGVGIITNGFRIFCNGTLTNNGTIKWNGNAGTNTGVAGAALNKNTSSFNTGLTTSSPGLAGGAGNTGAGSAGVTGASTFFLFGGTAGSGGAGGSGGGNAGTGTAVTATAGNIRSIPTAIIGQLTSGNGSTVTRIQGGNGAGGGGGDGTFKGGGGGGGGGVVIAAIFMFAGTGNIQALGGNGGDGEVGATNAGGGGAGGGGLIILISRSLSSGTISGQTISVAPGTPGSGSGSGSSGNSGGNGTTILLPS